MASFVKLTVVETPDKSWTEWINLDKVKSITPSRLKHQGLSHDGAFLGLGHQEIQVLQGPGEILRLLKESK